MAKHRQRREEPTKPGDADLMNLGLGGQPTAPSVADHVLRPGDRRAAPPAGGEVSKPRTGSDHETMPSHPPTEEVEKFLRDPADVVGDVDLT
jgi:hypothetical protein